MTTENTGNALDIANAFAGADFGFEGQPDEQAATTQADEESAAEEAEGQADEDEQEGDEQAEGEADASPEGQQQDQGPGNLKVALREAREETKGLKAQLSALHQQFATMQQQQAQAQRQTQAEMEREQIRQTIEQMDPDEVPAYLERVQQYQAQRLQVEAEQRQAWDRLAQSETFARKGLKDYDDQIAKLVGALGLETVRNWALTQQNPALAAYEAASSLYTQADLDAAREAGRQEALKAQPVDGRKAATRLGAIPSAGAARSVNPQQALSKRLAKGGDVADTVAAMFAQANFG